jgi:SAP domain
MSPIEHSLEEYTVKELKVFLKERGLPVSGKKDELIARLEGAIGSSRGGGGGKGDDTDEEEEEEEEFVSDDDDSDCDSDSGGGYGDGDEDENVYANTSSMNLEGCVMGTDYDHYSNCDVDGEGDDLMCDDDVYCEDIEDQDTLDAESSRNNSSSRSSNVSDNSTGGRVGAVSVLKNVDTVRGAEEKVAAVYDSENAHPNALS